MRCLFLVHVGNGIEMDQETDTRNDQKKERGQLVNLEGKWNAHQLPYPDKTKIFNGSEIFLNKNHQAEDERSQNGAAAQHTNHTFRKIVAAQSIDQETKEGKQGDQND